MQARTDFTLVEMLVVITIIGLIMGLIGPRVLNYLGESKVKAARIQLQSFASALDLYYLDAGRFPSTAEGLAALVRQTAGRRGLERTISEGQRRAQRSLEPRLCVSVARRPRLRMTSCPTAPTARKAAAEPPPTSRSRNPTAKNE